MFSIDKTSKSARKTRLREAHKRWLAELSTRRNQTLTAIAREIGNDPSMLTRFMSDEERGSTLDTLTIAAIVEMLGEEPPADVIGGGTAPALKPAGFREAEAAPYMIDAADPFAAPIAALIGDALHLVPWVLKSRAIEGDGYLPGDILIVDLNAEPRSGDIVCAQLYNWKSPGATETVFRAYDAPYLIASGPVDEGRKPRLVDNENVIIKGVVSAMLRPPRR